ncbi:hypothetical protein FC40_GL000939 [Ligilactobacillus hayakitensis DSM 18933 = JCM 14209]|uniref:Lipoprotein n=1 Tax=Ligilactobacillus hayakitensis DSM 18933 = JCM 14209 TaxID=1423755 RepID=A0A0R1WQM5_9LACO|nr:hypothetical protein [Ligilactobacillus hayakitensis]KRM20062.1 hypothetical protein FC40_GL000939 [Ligilactobacillus hayakitensis DSM 18933 = JCM 14209]
MKKKLMLTTALSICAVALSACGQKQVQFDDLGKKEQSSYLKQSSQLEKVDLKAAESQKEATKQSYESSTPTEASSSSASTTPKTAKSESQNGLPVDQAFAEAAFRTLFPNSSGAEVGFNAVGGKTVEPTAATIHYPEGTYAIYGSPLAAGNSVIKRISDTEFIAYAFPSHYQDNRWMDQSFADEQVSSILANGTKHSINE